MNFKKFLISFSFLLILVSCYSQNSLFKKYKQNPIIKIGSSEPDWRAIHVANAAILSPDETSDHTWRIYIRGSGKTPDYHDQIGILYQDTVGFSPYGPWLEYENNPVLKYGLPGEYDEKNLLDCAPVVGANNDVYFYYKAVKYDGSHSMAGAKSTDGGFTFQKFDSNPLLDRGINDVVYHDQKYYIFFGQNTNNKLETHLKITSKPDSVKNVDMVKVLPAGGGPDNFDSKSVHGTRIFRLQDKWYMIYQGSDTFIDFPDRFHAAYSDDLIHWTKVDNDFPLMTRGSLGDWDQGGIWYGEVFEYKDSLYMLYEGWGCYCIPEDRDIPYFPGNSRTGIAKVSTADFLLWADGGFDSSWEVNIYGDDGTIINFEDRLVDLFPNNNMSYEIINNPFPDEVNSSQHCGKIITTSDQYELLYSSPLGGRFDFSGGSKFKMKVYSEVEGNVYFKIEHPTNYTFGQMEVKKYLSITNEWVDMEFDFESKNPVSDLYGKIVLLFDAAGTSPGNSWYFDDVKFASFPTSTDRDQTIIKNSNKINVSYDFINQQIVMSEMDERDPFTVYSIRGVTLLQGKGKFIKINNLDKGVYIIKTTRGTAKFIK
jgi:hypothetical protein